MIEEPRPFFKNLIQVGIVVSSLQKSIEKYLDNYGIGPWYVLKFCPDNVSNMYIQGKRKDYSMNIGVCSIGDVRFELIEPIDESIYSEFHRKYGEGIIHHLKLQVDNYQDALRFLKSKGVKVLQSGHQLGKIGKNIYTYLSTANNLGFIAEIVDVPPDFIKPDPDYWYPDNKGIVLKPIFKRLTQIGIVVENLQKKVEEYSEIFGIRPWYIKKYSSNNIRDMHVHGARKDYSINIAFCKIGNLQFKLIEPIDESIYSEFYEKYGEGVVHHLKMEVENYQDALGFFKSKGINVIQSGSYLGKIKYSYLSTSKDINFITEIADINHCIVGKDCVLSASLHEMNFKNRVGDYPLFE